MPKIYITPKQWQHVQTILSVHQLPNTRSKKGKILRNFAHQLNPPNHYPRIHFVAVYHRKGKYFVDIHADMAMHSEVNHWHPKLDKIMNLINNS